MGNPEDANSAIEIDFQIGANEISQRVRLDVLAQIGVEAAFNQLRTVEQLGTNSTKAEQKQGILGIRQTLPSSWPELLSSAPGTLAYNSGRA